MAKQRLLIKGAAEIATPKGGRAIRGAAMGKLEIIPDGAVVVEDGVIQAVGTTAEMLREFDSAAYRTIDARGKCLLPGFVDSHTHFVFAGYRADEFSWRLDGVRYMEIMQRGGGIMNSVHATRQAAAGELMQLALPRLDTMLSMGVTAVEGKSGYGLDKETELKQLEVMAALHERHPVEVVPTFMGAHAVPPEFSGRSAAFVEFLIDKVLPDVAARRLAKFCDVFCEQGVFSLEDSRRLLGAARHLGLAGKLHADEIVPLGGAELAVELGAVSADHLLHVSDRGIMQLAQGSTVATLLPATAFSLREPYAPGRRLIDAGAAVALATDFNPGSCFTSSIPLVIALAALYMQLSPSEIVTALTLNGAAAIGEARRLGSIEVGKQADMILLDYPSHTYLPYHIGMNCVGAVVKKGQLVWTKEKGIHDGKSRSSPQLGQGSGFFGTVLR